ncbi:MAG: hypothetical protein K2H20_00030, partial [Bacilli bacterium]|nr:hypothetical protein [Bacilli bacterium]
ITSRNKDKDILKELAQTVIDIKHRRQFPETPLEIIKRLEEELSINLIDGIDMNIINNTSSIKTKDYEEYINDNQYEEINDVESIELNNEEIEVLSETKRGIKVIDETDIAQPISASDTEDSANDTAAQRLEAAIQEVSNNEENSNEEQIQPEVTSQDVVTEIEQSEEDEEPLDIGEIIQQSTEQESPTNGDKLSINTMFNQQSFDNSQNDDNIVTSQDLEDELDQYLSNLDKQD